MWGYLNGCTTEGRGKKTRHGLTLTTKPRTGGDYMDNPMVIYFVGIYVLFVLWTAYQMWQKYPRKPRATEKEQEPPPTPQVSAQEREFKCLRK